MHLPKTIKLWSSYTCGYIAIDSNFEYSHTLISKTKDHPNTQIHWPHNPQQRIPSKRRPHHIASGERRTRTHLFEKLFADGLQIASVQHPVASVNVLFCPYASECGLRLVIARFKINFTHSRNTARRLLGCARVCMTRVWRAISKVHIYYIPHGFAEWRSRL